MGMNHYYRGEFSNAIKYFVYAREFLPNDPILRIYLARCENYVRNPPGENWQGYTVLSEK